MKLLAWGLVALLAQSSAVLACGGGGYSGASGGKSFSPEKIAALEAQIAENDAILAEINAINADLDKAIAIAKGVDVVTGAVFGMVPFGGTAYSAGKVVGYGVMGDLASAGHTAIGGVRGAVLDQLGAVGTVVDFAFDAQEAADVAEEIGEAFSE